MRIYALAIALLLLLGLAGQGLALTSEEIIKLKKAGVSDETIQMMLQQKQKGAQQTGPVTETKEEIVYSAGESNRQKRDERDAYERWKEKKALDAAGNVIIDGRRRPVAGPRSPGAPGGTTPGGGSP